MAGHRAGSSRREFLRCTAWFGATLASLGLLAACGGEPPPGAKAPASTSSAAPSSASASAPASTAAGSAPAASSASGSASSSAPSSAASSAAPTPAPVGSAKAGRVLVRTPGGAYEEAWRKASWEPFAAETGIQVVPIATNAGKILAMAQAGNVDLDVLDLGEQQTLLLQKADILEKLDTSKFTLTNLKDIDPVNEYYLGNNVFASVLGYNAKTFASKHPTSWAEFWDVNAFPGQRMLEDFSAGAVDLEFALLADGVPMDKLYPIDVERALRKLQAIRKNILKWWDTGALSAQLFSENQVVLGSVWNGRIQVLIDGGAPLAIEWNQAKRELQAIAIVKKAPNLENAYKLIDYTLQPKVMAEFAKRIGYGPANRKAFEHIDEKTAAKLPTSPEHLKLSFAASAQWWVDNTKMITDRWQEFLLAK